MSSETYWRTVCLVDPASGRPIQYSFGEYISKMQGHLVWGHGGGINGFASKLTRYPAEELTVIVLSNLENAEVDKITGELAEIALGEWVKPTEITLAPTILDQYTGAYLLAPGVVLRVRREGDHLTIQFTRRARAPLYASGERAFFAKVVDSKLVFDPPVDGKSGRVLYTEAAAERPSIPHYRGARRIDRKHGSVHKRRPRRPVGHVSMNLLASQLSKPISVRQV